MTQTSVDVRSAQWYDGQITRPQDLDDRTALNEDTTAFKIGYAAIAGTDPDTQMKKPAAAFTFDQFVGVVYSAVGISEKALSTGTIDIVTNQRAVYARKGYMAILVTSTAGLTITKGEDVFFVHTTGGDSTQWTYRNDLDTDKASKIPAIFMQSATVAAGGSAILEIKINADMSIGVS